MHVDAVRLLACPVCGSGLHADGSRVVCGSRHSFDIARQGYVNLLTGSARANTGDSADMVAARERFLARGHYDAIAAETGGLFATHRPANPHAFADVGGGTGWLTARVLSDVPESGPALCLDLSKAAARRAARVHPRCLAVVADAWGRLPIADASLGSVLSFFAPRNPPEFARTLAPGGIVVLISPAPDHLVQARAALGLIDIEPDKDERIAKAFAERFEPLVRHAVRADRCLTRSDLADLVAMGPTAHHRAPDEVEAAIAGVAAETEVTFAVNVTVHRRI